MSEPAPAASDASPGRVLSGCCSLCGGTGISGDPQTNGSCWDCRGTGCAHPDPCTQHEYGDRCDCDLCIRVRIEDMS